MEGDCDPHGTAGVGLAQSLNAVQNRKLSGPLPPQGSIHRFSISDDQVHALYVGDHTGLHSISLIDGTTADLHRATIRVT